MENGRKQWDTRGIRKSSQAPRYFLKYYAWSALLFSIIDVVLFLLRGRNPLHVTLSATYLFLIPFGLYLGGLSAVFIHNSAHGNFRPRWLNRVAGELASTHQLYGFVGWRTAHIIHHHYPDDPERDPHPPLNLSFWEFSNGMRARLGKVLTDSYFDIWGRSEESQRIWKLKNLCGYSHFNYYTHQRDRTSGEGEFEVLNLSKGVYYRLANLMFFGIYHHRNHHSNPICSTRRN